MRKEGGERMYEQLITVWERVKLLLGEQLKMPGFNNCMHHLTVSLANALFFVLISIYHGNACLDLSILRQTVIRQQSSESFRVGFKHCKAKLSTLNK